MESWVKLYDFSKKNEFSVAPESRTNSTAHEYALVGPVITLTSYEMTICLKKEEREAVRGRNVLNVSSKKCFLH